MNIELNKKISKLMLDIGSLIRLAMGFGLGLKKNPQKFIYVKDFGPTINILLTSLRLPNKFHKK